MRLETERLMIRSIEKGDEVIFSEMAKDGSLLDVGFDANCSEWMSEWVDEAIRLEKADNPQKDYIAYTVCRKDSGIVIGAVGCSYYEDLKETGITYFIGQEYRGNGYAAESVQAYADYFFSHYPIRKLIATIREDNVPSWKTIEKSCFHLDECRMYQDINDDQPKRYRFYSRFSRL